MASLTTKHIHYMLEMKGFKIDPAAPCSLPGSWNVLFWRDYRIIIDLKCPEGDTRSGQGLQEIPKRCRKVNPGRTGTPKQPDPVEKRLGFFFVQERHIVLYVVCLFIFQSIIFGKAIPIRLCPTACPHGDM